MLTSRQLDTEETTPKQAKRRSARSTSKPKRAGSSDKSVQRKLKTANKQASKADKARAKAEVEQKAAEKALTKANKQAKKNERAASREQRELKKERKQQRRSKRSSGVTDQRPVRTGRGRERNSSRKGFERRSSSRIRFMIVAALAAISSIIIGVVVYVNSSAFGVASIEVTGESKATAEEIISASAIEIDQNLLKVEPSEVAEEIEKVAWIDQVSVERKWNGSVVISVTERQAVAALESPSGFVLVDNDGRQLEKVSSAPASQIPVSGVEVSGVIGEDVSVEGLQATNFIGSIPPQIRPMVMNIGVDSGRLVAQLDVEQIEQDFAAANPSIEANFGTNQELDEKMTSLETVLARVDLTCVVRIDLSSPSKPTVLRTPAITNLEKLPTGLVDC